MSRRNRLNLILLIFVIAAIIVVYNIFSTDKAIAPEASTLAPIPTATKSEDTNFQLTSAEVKADILMYHHIGPLPENADNIRKGLTVSTEEFEEHLKYLKDNKFKFLTLSELQEATGKLKVPEKVAVLTFDDGYDDNFAQAWPVMKKYGVKGTFFIISSKVGQNEYMNKEQVKELSDSGNEVGSHSVTHPSLDKLKGTALEKEVKKSKEDLESITGKKISSFCYPAGKYNEDTIKALKEAGYTIATTTQASTGSFNSSTPFETTRYRISSSMSFAALFR